MFEIPKRLAKLIFCPDEREFIINHPYDADVYKFYMLYYVWKHHQDVIVKYRFLNRTKIIKFAENVPIEEVKKQIYHLKDLVCTSNDVDAFRRKMEESGLDLETAFYQWLLSLNKQRKARIIIKKQTDGQLYISISGPWTATILYETWILSIVNELYFRTKLQSVRSRLVHYGWGFVKLAFKVAVLRFFPGIKVALFGTRRRSSFDWEDFVSWFMVKYVRISQLLGISNVLFAIRYNRDLKGTSAHEMYMVLAAIASTINRAAMLQVYPDFLRKWDKLFNGKLNVALTDTFTSAFFFQMLRESRDLISLYNVLRQDSGSPEAFTYMALKFYRSLSINPKTKTILYSDGLDIWRIVKLWWKFHKEINVAFGWGTNLTNDVGLKTLSLVVKIWAVKVDGKWVLAIKLSDNPSKGTGGSDKLREWYVEIFNIGYFQQVKFKCRY